MTPIALRLPDELVEQLDKLVGSRHATRSEAIRRAIELYLYRLACERDAEIYRRMPLTDDELALADDAWSWQVAPEW